MNIKKLTLKKEWLACWQNSDLFSLRTRLARCGGGSRCFAQSAPQDGAGGPSGSDGRREHPARSPCDARYCQGNYAIEKGRELIEAEHFSFLTLGNRYH